MAKKVYALMVGIDAYQSPVPALNGCVNDIEAVRDFLQGRVSKDQFALEPLVLLDQQATRQAVIDGFRKHLSKAKEGDVALFYYAGHGAQEEADEVFWTVEPDRRNETLVCYDSRSDGGWDLADKELAKLIGELSSTQAHVLIVLDCCHSGSGTRAAPSGEVRTRRAPLDTRKRPLDSYIFSQAEVAGFTSSRSTTTADWFNVQQGNHVLMAACRPEQLAKEAQFEGQAHGAFTAALLETLQQSGSLSYRDLTKRIENQLKNTIADQNPQLEPVSPELERPFLGGAIPERQPYFTLRHQKDAGWTIDGGAVHGLRQGSGDEHTELAIFAAGSSAVDIKAALGMARVTDVLPDRSLVKLEWKAGQPDPQQTYKAIVTQLPLPKLQVLMEGDAGALELVRGKLATLNAGKPSLLAEEVKAGGKPDIRLLVSAGAYWLTKPDSLWPLTSEVSGLTAENAEVVAKRLEHIARWQTTLKLENPESSLAGKVKLEVHQVTGAAVTRDPSSAPSKLVADSDVRLDYRQQNGKWKEPSIKVKVSNNSDQTLWCALLGLTESFQIASLLSNNAGVQKLEPKEEVWVNSGRPIPTSVPDDLYQLGFTERQDVLKLVVSTTDFDATLLEQDKLDSPTKKEVTRSLSKNPLSRLAKRVQTREIGGPSQDDEFADWWTDSITLTTVRQQGEVAVSSAAEASAGKVKVKVKAGSNFKAKAKLSTLNQATRSAEGFKLPPILSDYPEAVRTVHFSTTRASTPPLEVFELSEIENPDEITPDNPLLLEIPDGFDPKNEQIIPMAVYRDDEGEYYLPIGYAKPLGTRAADGGSEVVIPRLPNVPNEARTRSVLNALKMMFLKIAGDKVGLAVENQHLSAVEFGADGKPSYLSDSSQVKQRVDALQPSDKILLYVHGILGNTKDMVGSVGTTPTGATEPISQHYKLILAYDYENLNTSIKDTAKQLGVMLGAVGLGVGHNKQLHLAAHSMGGLVSRWFIEQEGGDAQVQQLVMLGTPNAGSPWPSVQEWATNILTLAVNGLAPTGWVGGILHGVVGLLNALERVDTTLDQMKAGSDFLKDLGTRPSPKVPYILLAGDYTLAPRKEGQQLFNKIWDTLLAASSKRLFDGKPNDLAASVESVLTPAPDPKPQPVGSDHFSYFAPAVGLGSLAKALAEKPGG